MGDKIYLTRNIFLICGYVISSLIEVVNLGIKVEYLGISILWLFYPLIISALMRIVGGNILGYKLFFNMNAKKKRTGVAVGYAGIYGGSIFNSSFMIWLLSLLTLFSVNKTSGELLFISETILDGINAGISLLFTFLAAKSLDKRMKIRNYRYR